METTTPTPGTFLQSRDSKTLRLFVHAIDADGFVWVSAFFYGCETGTEMHRVHPATLEGRYVAAA